MPSNGTQAGPMVEDLLETPIQFFGWILDALGREIAIGITLLILVVIGIAFPFIQLRKLLYWFCLLLEGPALAARLGITAWLGERYLKRAERHFQRKPKRALDDVDEAISLLKTARAEDRHSQKILNLLVSCYDTRAAMHTMARQNPSE